MGARWTAVRDSGRELGTSYEIELVVNEAGESSAHAALSAARRQCHELERLLSEWREDSEISLLNREAAHGPVPVSDRVSQLLAGALHVARATEGTFDFTWAPLGALWDRAAQRDRLPDAHELTEVRAHLGFGKVSVQGGMVSFSHPETRIGVASFAKGWIIDAIFHGMRRRGFKNVIVNIGGDLRVSGHDIEGQPQAFDVLDPYDPTRAATKLGVMAGALATSGNYFRHRTIGGQAYGHLFDPSTGAPPAFDGSVTVLAADAAMADALATALFIMGPERGLTFAKRVPGLEALYLTRTGPQCTAGLRERLRSANGHTA